MYRILKSFAGPRVKHDKGDVVESLPEGSDWVKIGFAEKVTTKGTAKTKRDLKKSPQVSNK